MSLPKLSLVVIILFTGAPLDTGMLAARQDAPMAQVSKTAAAQATEYPNLKIQAQAVADAFAAADYKKFVTFLYPRLVELGGGSEAMVNLLIEGMRDMEAKGIRVLSYTVGEPDPATHIGQGLYAIVPARMRTQAPPGVVVVETFMIGVSRDGGKTWTFLGGAGANDEAQLRLVLPEVVGKLKIPEKKQPSLERKQ